MNKINPKEYNEYVQKKIPKPTFLKNSLWAFFIGGIICTFGQFIINFYKNMGLDKDGVSAATAITLVFLGAFFTGLGWYDKLGKRAGAGSIVPITGFANSIVSPAMEFKREGFIFGVAARMFTVAGPVLVYGYGSSVIVGLIYYLVKK
ncbi:stage V sporulation protein AC [Caloranaerobacter azorensis DSM 13643]|uniref:Stage V sporulation protein AC n=1 Tax=Caloranaerobacter azorensis DSM 13643 TaxID=1121264 RepID=A0A1M5V7K5_9FIRM|nr:stage V sporulation protein AC [Caloranaerobacter azorensis]SHH71118.1 stage V sporulation protein AC [Caloranaerobacter azorensis DSM 13643]